MKLKMNNKIVLIISCIWFMAVLIPFMLVLHNLKFPVIDNVFPIILMFAMPIMGIVFSVIPEKFVKPVLFSTIGICFVVYLIYIMFATLGFTDYKTPFYPISVSATDKTSDYLVLDDLGEIDENESVRKVFPEKIPVSAVEADYDYECEPFKFSWKIEASWILPKEEFDKEQDRIKSMTDKKVEKDGNIYYDLSTKESYCHVRFNNEECSVEYVDILGYYYDYRKVSGIGDWQ